MTRILFPAITATLFAGSFIAAKYATADLSPLAASFLRYIAAFAFLNCLILKYRISALRISARDIYIFVLLGLTGIVGYHYFFFLSLHYTAIANTAIINAANPVMTALLAAVFIGERLTFKNITGVILAAAGTAILLTGGHPAALFRTTANTGDLLMLCAAASWAVYALMAKNLTAKKYSGFAVTYYSSLFGMALLGILVWVEGSASQMANISLPSVLAVLYMGIAASGLGYLLYNMSIDKIGPTRTASVVYSLVPVLTAALAFAFFNQPLSWSGAASMAVIIFAMRNTLSK